MKKILERVILIHKKEGETPLEALDRFRSAHAGYKDVKMTYAGRLDPMATGLLLVLVGEEVKNKEKYLALPKEYEFEILFGCATDTYDILGKVTSFTRQDGAKKELVEKINDNLKHFTGKFIQAYPAYSSKTVHGKQLFAYAREGTTIESPRREISIDEIKFLTLRVITNKKLLANIEKRIRKVRGDFRQAEIIKIWEQKLQVEQKFFIGSFKIKCGSGTYIRGIANSLGEKIGILAVAFSINRTKIGKWRKRA